MYNQLTTQFGRYMGHVAKNIGGIYENPKTTDQAGAVYEYTPAATQREAMTFLDKQLFTTPTWLLNQQVLSDIGMNPLQVIYTRQDAVLGRIVTPRVFNKLVSFEAVDGSKAYKVTDFMADMQNMIFREVKSGKAIDVYRRNLQKLYVDKLIDMVKPQPAANAQPAVFTGRGAAPRELEQTDAVSVAKAQLRSINSLIKSANISDSMSTYHLQDLSDRITEALNPKS
jgi:hypothetical protein